MKHLVWLAIIFGVAPPADGHDLHPMESGRSAVTATNPPEPTVPLTESIGVITLREAVALALTDNPELAPFVWREQANEARTLQANRRLNPELSLEVEDIFGSGELSGASQAQTTLQLSQVIELGGKRARRTDVASQARGFTHAEYEMARVDVVANVALRFIDVVAAQQSLELADTNRQLAEDALRTVQERAKAGKGSALEAMKAQVALARGEVLIGAARHELNAARRMLAASWRDAEPAFESAEADLFARKPVPPYRELVNQISTSPGITRWISEKRLREAEIKLADARRVPNLTLGAGIRRQEGVGDESLVFGLSMPLQIFDRNHGGRAESRALLGRSEAEREAAEFRLSALLRGLYEATARDSHLMEGLEKEILPRAEEALAISREAFTHGRLSYLEVLDAQRTVYEVRHEYIRAATSYHRFLVEIERLTGQPFDGGGPRR